jgi:hypothetical protein
LGDFDFAIQQHSFVYMERMIAERMHVLAPSRVFGFEELDRGNGDGCL